jgi:hypothetical protein
VNLLIPFRRNVDIKKWINLSGFEILKGIEEDIGYAECGWHDSRGVSTMDAFF